MISLTPGLVQLWLTSPAELNHQFEELKSYLSTDEDQRAASYKLEAPRLQFILARGFLRRTLARYVDALPATLSFGTTANEKPVLLGVEHLHFNLSHTANAIALAVAGDRPVGVDVEEIQPRRSLSAIVKQQFHVREQADHAAADQAHQLDVFYRIWTCKEAYLKGLGQGFALPLSSFAMQRSGDRFVAEPNLDHQAWSLISEIHPGYALAIAAPGNWDLARVSG